MKVRIIAIRPFGKNTNQFIHALRRQPALQTRIVEKEDLPHLTYDYVSYNPLEYSSEAAHRIFIQHQNFYSEQIEVATQAGEVAMLISGRFHEFTAPFYVALKEYFKLRLKAISFDAHFDCFGSRFTAGGFFRYLIDGGHLFGPDLAVVGIPGKKDYEGILGIGQIVDVYHMLAVYNPHRYFPKIHDLAKLYFFSQSCRDFQTIEIPGEEERQIDGIIMNCLIGELERRWAQQKGVVENLDPSIISKDRPLLVSFDGDVSDRNGVLRDADSLHPHFEQLKRAQVSGIHVSELDSPNCNFNINELAALFASAIAS